MKAKTRKWKSGSYINKSVSDSNLVYVHQQITLPKMEDCTQIASSSYSVVYICKDE